MFYNHFRKVIWVKSKLKLQLELYFCVFGLFPANVNELRYNTGISVGLNCTLINKVSSHQEM